MEVSRFGGGYQITLDDYPDLDLLLFAQSYDPRGLKADSTLRRLVRRSARVVRKELGALGSHLLALDDRTGGLFGRAESQEAMLAPIILRDDLGRIGYECLVGYTDFLRERFSRGGSPLSPYECEQFNRLLAIEDSLLKQEQG